MKNVWRFIRIYMWPYWLWYLAGMLMLLVTNYIAVEIPLYLAAGIDALAASGDQSDLITRNAAIVALLGVAVIVVRTGSRLLFFTPGRLIEAQLKRDLFASIINHQPTFLAQFPTGDLMSRATSDVNTLRMFAGFTVLGIINTVVALTLTAGQMIRISPLLAVAVSVPLLIGFAVTQGLARQFHAVMRALQRENGVLSEWVLSSYQGHATVQTFGAKDAFLNVFHDTNDKLLRATLRRSNLRVAFGPALGLAAAIDVFVLLWIGGPMAIAGTLSIGEIIAFTTLVAYLTGPLRGMSFIIALVSQTHASLERLDVLLYTPADRPEATAGIAAQQAPVALDVRGLSFAYPDSDGTLALDDVSFSVPAGATLGVVGPTGAGKSTLLKLIYRWYNPPRGAIFVDGVDVLDLDLDRWRDTATLVPQRAFLFTESLRDNVLLGAEDDVLLDQVVRRASLAPDLRQLPAGALTVVGEAGMTLSGGQRQRVALARGLARGGALLALDDVLSAVDHKTEHELVEALRSPSTRTTTILVAHRLSALEGADHIIVLDRGRLVDQGTHAALIARPGLYATLWERQREGADT